MALILKRLTLVLFCIAASRLWPEENYGLNTPSFLPLSAHVGDPVLYHVELVAPDHARIEIPQSLPSEQWIEVTDIKISLVRKLEARNVYAVNLFFISFKTGIQALPPIDLGDVTLRDIEVRTLSVLGTDEMVRLSPPRGQLVLPETWFVIAILVCIVLGFVFSILAIVFFARKIVMMLRDKRLKRLPATRMKKSLRTLLGSKDLIPEKEFFARISDMVRVYLADRLGLPAVESTTSEIRVLFENNDVNQSASDCAIGILSDSDRVKFAGKAANPGQLGSIADRVARLSRFVDEEDAHVER